MRKAWNQKTKEQFILEARQIHGWKYDYSKVEYINQDTKVCIICPEHGEFWQTPYSHLSGHEGCKECCKCKLGRNIFKTQDDFICEANNIHNGKYDYSKVEYKGDKEKVCIICPKHGEFWQTPYNHLKGKGCPDCYGNRKLTTEQFIEKAKNIHGDKYDYSKVEYKNTDTKVCIICPEHGEFWQTPYKHIKRQQGCSICGDTKKTTTEEFIKKAHKIHGNRYDYSKVEYVNQDTKVCIICHSKNKFGKEHGEFWQTPNKHLQGHGCPNCKMSYLEEQVKNTLDEFKISYKYQANKKQLKWLGTQTLDFYLFGLNCAIEVQGQQHFIPVKHWGGEKNLEKIKELDKNKKELCEKNNVKLYYITYNENIIEKTKKILNENGLRI